MDRCPACPVASPTVCESVRRNSPSQCRTVAAHPQLADGIVARSLGWTEPERPRPSGPIAGPPWPCPSRRVILRTFLNDYSGFGRFGVWTGKSLEMAGVPVEDEQFRDVSEWQRGRIVDAAPEPWRLQAHYLGYPIANNKASVYFTMSETSRLRPDVVAELNRCRAVVVPCRFNAEGFAASGVTPPIYVVNPGLAPEEGFTFVEGQGATRTDGVFRVLFAGMLQHGGMRKGVKDAIAGFLRAFPDEADVELILKLWPTCKPHTGTIPDDPRIRVVTDPMTTHELADLYRRCTVLLAPTRGEGAGLHTMEAMGCGVPPIVPLATGTTEFLTEDTGYPIEFDWEDATGYYLNMGQWAVPRMPSIVAQLRRAYGDRGECAEIARRAVERMKAFTWEKSGRELAEVLREVGMLAPEPSRRAKVFARVIRCGFRRKTERGCNCQSECQRLSRLVSMPECLECVQQGLDQI
jgi:glycosyltransferase involved in cell wall biosynthesis